jgi:hypothetical protein
MKHANKQSQGIVFINSGGYIKKKGFVKKSVGEGSNALQWLDANRNREKSDLLQCRKCCATTCCIATLWCESKWWTGIGIRMRAGA